MVDVHARLIRHLEQTAGLNRKLEFLPTDDAIDERKAAHQGLVAPELAVVMAYCKIHLYQQLLDSDLPEDGYLAPRPRALLPRAAARALRRARCASHRLKREIIATVVANQLVDRAGTTFAFRLGEETGRAAGGPGAGVRHRARGARDALVLGRGRGARQPGRRPDPARDADRGPAAGRARDPLARAREPLPGRASRRRSGAFEPGAELLAARAPRRARGRGPRGVRRAGGRARAGRRARRAGPADRRDAVDARAVRHRRGGVDAPSTTRTTCCGCTSGSARASSSTGCATGSSSCRAPTAGRRWPAPRCATTCSTCTGS